MGFAAGSWHHLRFAELCWIIWPVADWLTIQELAAHLKLPVSSVYKMLQSGQLPGHKVGRAWRCDRDEVDTWVRDQGPRPIQASSK